MYVCTQRSDRQPTIDNNGNTTICCHIFYVPVVLTDNYTAISETNFSIFTFFSYFINKHPNGSSAESAFLLKMYE